MSTSFRIRAFHAKAPVALNLRVSLLILREPQPRPSRLPPSPCRGTHASLQCHWNSTEDSRTQTFDEVVVRAFLPN